MPARDAARPLGLERLCVFGMPPVAFVELARELGCSFIGIGLTAMRACNPHGYPNWSLRDDPALRRQTRQALAAAGVAIGLVEGFALRRDADVAALERDLDIAAELGARRINAVSLERDTARAHDQFARLCELAAARDIEVATEVGAGALHTWAAARETVEAVGRPNFRLLIDTMHLFRFADASVAEVAATPAALIGYVQLCDAPLRPAFSTYMEEALYERRPPGEGELPLADLLASLPAEVPVSLEVPQRALAQAGVGPRERVGACVAAARRLLAEVDARRPPSGALSPRNPESPGRRPPPGSGR